MALKRRFHSGGTVHEADVAGKDQYGTCRAVSTFERRNRIGEGTYGTVYRAIDRRTNEVVALKKVILHNEKQVGFPITSLREVRLLKRLAHPNCVLLRDVAVGPNRGYLTRRGS